MQRVQLGRNGIEVSKLGIGTGTAHPSGHCAQALMDVRELARLLVYAFERGVNFWDTAAMYETHVHVREALKHVPRSDVVITTKLNTASKKDTIRDFNVSLKELAVDYVDVCLVHGVRSAGDFIRRRGAFEALLDLKRSGHVRAVGLSSHGLSALTAASDVPEIELVWARINYAGLCMDSCKLGLYDKIASISWLKRAIKRVAPKRLISAARPAPEKDLISGDDYTAVEEALKMIHSQSKGIVGMKVLGAGQLRDTAQKAVKYVNSLPYIDSFIIGMLNKDEINENCKIVSRKSI